MIRKKQIVFGLGVVLLVALAGFFLLKGGKSGSGVKSVTSTEAVKSDEVGLLVQKDTSLVQSTLGKEKKERGQLWEFRQPADGQQEFAIDANYEQGESLKKLAAITKKPLAEAVLENVNIQLPQQYPEYKEITQRKLTVNGFEANETIFEYTSSGVRIKQRLLLLFKNSDTAVYIRGQAKAAEYDEVNTRYFEPIFSSARFQ